MPFRRENFSRIIAALDVKYIKVSRREVIKPVELVNTFEQKDVLVQVNSGFFACGALKRRIPQDAFYFVPRGQSIHFRHGSGPYTVMGAEGFTSIEQREQYLKPLSLGEPISGRDVFSIVGFDVLVHGAIPFFPMLDMPCVLIEKNTHIGELFSKMLTEEEGEDIGRPTMLKKFTEEMVIQLCRHIYNTPSLAKNVENLEYLLDKRLISIIQYIQDNLDKDLSNHQIASLAYISKDYVGQFFKSLTNHNLQDYIESRRLDHAHFLLRTTNDNIQEIAHKVGFKDPAYFSRRFKIRFSQNAKEVRKSDNVVM
jgi:AraC-like DNA-binding protein